MGRFRPVQGRVGAAFAAFGLAAAGSAILGGINREGIQFLQVLFAALGALLLGSRSAPRWMTASTTFSLDAFV